MLKFDLIWFLAGTFQSQHVSAACAPIANVVWLNNTLDTVTVAMSVMSHNGRSRAKRKRRTHPKAAFINDTFCHFKAGILCSQVQNRFDADWQTKKHLNEWEQNRGRSSATVFIRFTLQAEDFSRNKNEMLFAALGMQSFQWLPYKRKKKRKTCGMHTEHFLKHFWLFSRIQTQFRVQTEVIKGH